MPTVVSVVLGQTASGREQYTPNTPSARPTPEPTLAPDLATLRARKNRGPAVDRTSIDDARRVLDRLLPDPAARDTVLDLMVAYIERAHHHSSGCWTLTVYPSTIRLNLGRLLAIEVLPGALWALALVPSRTHEALGTYLRGERVHALLAAPHDQVLLPLAHIAGAKETLLADAPAVVAATAPSSSVCPYRSGWSSGLWQLLRTRSPTLPEPSWRARVEAEQAERGVSQRAGTGIASSAWSSDLWQWIERSAASAGHDPTFRLYWFRDLDSDLYVNARIANGKLRVDVDDHLIALVDRVPESFVENLRTERYRKTWRSGAAKLRRAKGTTVSMATAAHTALLPNGAPSRITVSVNVYRALFLRQGELSLVLAPADAEQLDQFVSKGLFPSAFTQLELAVALGLLDEADTSVPDDEEDEEEETEEDPDEDATDDVVWEDHRNVIFFGPPGTGKSYELDQLVRNHLKANRDHVYRITFHPETSYFDFVGTYKPVVGWLRSLNEFTAADRTTANREPRVYYDFDPGPMSLALADALAHPDDRVVLIIEEINRGNTAAIFGDVFQLLDRVHAEEGPVPYGTSEYPIHPGAEWARWLDSKVPECDPYWVDSRLRLPPNLYLYATMNTSDQSLFPMDTAFRRRWGLRYKGVSAPVSLATRVRRHADDRTGVLWSDLMRVLNRAIVEHTRTDDKQVGPWYLRPKVGSDMVPSVEFRSKVLFYLWSDVFRDAPDKVFRDDITTYDELLQRYDAGEEVFLPELLAEVPGA